MPWYPAEDGMPRLNLERRRVAPIHVHLTDLLLLATLLPESENPFCLWEKPHKKKKAQLKNTLVSIYNWGVGGRNFTQIQHIHEK